MTGLEDDLGATFRRHASAAEGAARPLGWEPPTGTSRRPAAAWLLPTVAAVTAVLFVAGAGAALVTLDGSSGSPSAVPMTTMSIAPSPTSSASITPTPLATAGRPSTPTRTSIPTGTPAASRASATPTAAADARPAKPPKGKKAYRYRGVEVFADSYLELNAYECGAPMTDTIVVGPPPTTRDANGDGFCQSQSDGVFVYLVPSDSEVGREHRRWAKKRIDFYGETAYVASDCERCAGGRLRGTSILYLPERKVVVAVDGGAWARDPAPEILESVRFVD